MCVCVCVCLYAGLSVCIVCVCVMFMLIRIRVCSPYMLCLYTHKHSVCAHAVHMYRVTCMHIRFYAQKTLHLIANGLGTYT